jgi:hypothetical protein
MFEAESTTGFVAFQLADGTTLVSAASQVFIQASRPLRFWSCAGYEDTTPDGNIIPFDCHGTGLTHLEETAFASLEYLDCSFNRLTTLDVSGLDLLQILDYSGNPIVSLKHDGCTALQDSKSNENPLPQ